jgi:hypothetical protein
VVFLLNPKKKNVNFLTIHRFAQLISFSRRRLLMGIDSP